MGKKKSKKPARKAVKRPVRRKAKPVKKVSRKVVRKTVRKPSRVVRGKFSPTAAQARALKNQRFSFGVKFERRKALSEIRGVRGWVSKPGKFRTSDRRFINKAEAATHGRRFKRIEGHVGFEVVKTSHRPNAWINLRTGKTNPVVGLRRTNRR